MELFLHFTFIFFSHTLTVMSRSVGSSTTPRNPSSSPYEFEQQCQAELSDKMIKCIVSFEEKLSVYNDEVSSTPFRTTMDKMLCREYEESLQCLHYALQACPPADVHLHLISSRIGHTRDFMVDVCNRARHPQTSTTTTQPTTTTTTSILPLPTHPMLASLVITVEEESSGELDTDSKDDIIKESLYTISQDSASQKEDKLFHSIKISNKEENEVLNEKEVEMHLTNSDTEHTAFRTMELKAERGCNEKNCLVSSAFSIKSNVMFIAFTTFCVHVYLLLMKF